MIILKMHASFGKLDGELSLHEGFNLLCLPNESGKSTWSAFLLAMLYGIDTSEKASAANNHLPAKERYRPWDGRSMHGRIDLLHNGRHITVERHTQGRIPMGVFSAYDTKSGTPIAELTAENCGKVLCGVERSVFERTAFIRQLGLSVSADTALEQRMNSLVTTGEEGVSASALLSSLHERRVKIDRPSTGRIPKLSQRADLITQQLEAIHCAEKEQLALRAKRDAAQEEVSRLTVLCTRIERAKLAQKQTAVRDLEQKYARQELACRELSAQVSALPTEMNLHRIKQELDPAIDVLHTAKLEQAFSPEPPGRPQPPACFVGLNALQAKAQQTEDEKRYRDLTNVPAPKKSGGVIAAVIAVLAAALCFVNLYIGLAAAILATVFFLIALRSHSLNRQTAEKSLREAEQILNRYGVDRIDKTALIANAYTAQCEQYEAALSAHSQRAADCSARVAEAEADLNRILREINTFAPNCITAEQGKRAIQDALALYGRYTSESRALELQRAQLLSTKQLIGTTAQHTPDPQALTFDEAKLRYEKGKAEDELRRLHDALSELNGRLSVMGDAAVLQAQLEQAQNELAEAKQQSYVLELAAEALKNADEALRSRFSPQITAEAAAILSGLTGGKYANLLLKPNMQLSVREETDALMHPAAAMSCGTADQMYLALRLAMVHRLLPEGAPLVLDDALVNFDDERCAAALKYLSKENRQIILFSCKEIPYVL